MNQMNNQKLKQYVIDNIDKLIKIGDVGANLETYVVEGLTAKGFKQKLTIDIVVTDVNDDAKFLGADLLNDPAGPYIKNS